MNELEMGSAAALQPVLTSDSYGWDKLQVSQWYSPQQAFAPSPEAKYVVGIHCTAYYENFYTIHIAPYNESLLCPWGRTSLYFLKIEMKASIIEEIARESGFLTEGQIQLQRQFHVKDSRLLQLGLWMLEELQNGGTKGKLYSDSLAHMFIIHLLQHYSSVIPQHASAKALANQEIYQVVQYMREHLEEDIQLSDLASRASMSQSHFIRVFKQQTGYTPHHFLIRLRIERSKFLIRSGKVGLKEIAAQVGFADQGHFTRVFKREIGLTPKLYAYQISSKPSHAFF
ncbi:AraC family transcriptional regulator [Cohnella terricola]|uniref:Helix-turn-helix transcriptional regulator n=1 Tax=Cohnella terricola TaxID=1289167 RepID=A0A559JNA0_9BACL|nr:AraC family transcriptional regulator [Cohnella terricola]TVY01362.1 helix-turn-helix transcriptional regulator [Cohnella terricola]